MAPSSASHPFGLSQIPGDPSFRNAAVNAVAVIPLLSSDDKRGGKGAANKSADSFRDLLTALQRHTAHPSSEGQQQSSNDDNLLLVVPNSSLTRPGDWRYNDTPLKAFHWQHGCQRLHVFDGRPAGSRASHDRLMNHTVTRNWIDLCPHRRTSAVIGVLNMHDCQNLADLHLAEEELHSWAERYAMPPYEVTAHGRTAERDQPVKRLFVYDSFDEECQKIDLSQTSMGTSILAFPPTDAAHAQMMDLHLNVVINDLAVAIFCDLERKIRESDSISSSVQQQAAAVSSSSHGSARRSLTRIISGTSSDGGVGEEPAQTAHNLTVSSMAGLVSPDSKLAKESGGNTFDEAGVASSAASAEAKQKAQGGEGTSAVGEQRPPLKPSSASTPLLLTPLDDYWEPSELSGRDVDAIRKRDAGRREKFAADLSLLAGSPLDAYERYLKAAELCKTLDPLWYASSLEGCATAHIAMAEAGGYSIDEYLENNFQLPDEFMAVVKTSKEEKRQTTTANKQTMPDIIFALCEEALNIVNRHPMLAPFHAELLLKLAWYSAEFAEMHLRCRWGEGDGCYPGEQGEQPRWERTSVHKLQFDDFKPKDGVPNPVIGETLQRTKKVCELLHQATTLGPLDAATRVDVATQSVALCLQGIKPMQWAQTSTDRVVLRRKAAFFACVGADAVSGGSAKNAGDLWLLATQLYSREGGSAYGWGALRVACLSALSTQGNNMLSLEAAEQLLSLLGELNPQMNEIGDSRSEDDDAPAQVTEDLDASVHSKSLEDSSAAKSSGMDTTSEVLKSTANTYAKQFQLSYNQMKANSAFLAQQSKWAYDDPVSILLLPLGDSSPLASSLTTLKSVWNSSDLSTCTSLQNECINRISVLRRSLATQSSQLLVDFPAVYGSGNEPVPPLFVESAEAIEAEASLEVAKAKRTPKQSGGGAMATFFNPYANKRDSGGDKPVTSVAEEEERAISVKFGNRLAVPLEIASCQLEFTGRDTSRVMATSLSFVLPPNASAFTIQFPFTVLASSGVASESTGEQGEDFEVSTIELTCLGRSFSIPIKPSPPKRNKRAFPVSVSDYSAMLNKKSDDSAAIDAGFPIQAYPCQPRLRILHADSHTPVESLSFVLSDGELYTSQPLRLECYAGPSGRGRVKQLEVHVGALAGLPGLNQKIFDTDSSKPIEPEQEFIGEMFDKDVSAPLKARVLAEGLTLDAVNGGAELVHDEGQSNVLRIQMATTHTMSKRLKKDTSVVLRFRYRGESNESTQVWRNHEITVNIKRSKGPRITSLSFEPDIHGDCYFGDLRSVLKLKTRDSETEAKEAKDEPDGKDEKLDVRVGQYPSINVSNSAVGLLVTVSNDTDSGIQLSKAGGPISSFGSNNVDQVLVMPSVSVRVPMILPRIQLLNKDSSGTVEDLVKELVSATQLLWKTVDATGEGGSSGQVRIPPECLTELIHKNRAFVSKVCDPPCTVELSVNQSPPTKSPLVVSCGSLEGLEIGLQIGVADRLTQEEREKCSVTMELLCVREKGGVGTAASTSSRNASSRDYVWAGKIRHKINNLAASSDDLNHKARIIFCNPGQYIVSGCARITHENAPKGVEEIWFAPVAARIAVEKVDSSLLAAQ